MLQDKAKVSIELDLDAAKKQLKDGKTILDDNAKLTTKKIEDTKDKVKKEGDKEVERQKNTLAEKLRGIARDPRRLLAPDIPERGIATLLSAIPIAGPVAGRIGAFTFRQADNLKLAATFAAELSDELVELTGAKDIPGVKAAADAIKKLATLTPDVKPIRELKSKWGAIGQTVEDMKDVFTGALMTGKTPNVEGFASKLYEYNWQAALLNKNKRFLQNEVMVKNIPEMLKGMKLKGSK